MTRFLLPLLLLAGLAGCEGLYPLDNAPAADIAPQCRDAVFADPLVKELIAKSAGSESYYNSHVEDVRQAKLAAGQRCMVQRGLARPGGGVERPRT